MTVTVPRTQSEELLSLFEAGRQSGLAVNNHYARHTKLYELEKKTAFIFGRQMVLASDGCHYVIHCRLGSPLQAQGGTGCSPEAVVQVVGLPVSQGSDQGCCGWTPSHHKLSVLSPGLPPHAVCSPLTCPPMLSALP